MRNPFPSIVSLSSSMNPFALVPDLESNVPKTSTIPPSSKSRFRKTRSRTRSSSTSHQRPHTTLSGASSYASAFRTALPTLSRMQTLELGGVNVREQDGVVFVEAPISTTPKLQIVENQRTYHISEGEAFTAGVGLENFDKMIHRDTGLGYGLGLEICALRNGVDIQTDVEREAGLRDLLDKYDPREQVGQTVCEPENHKEMVGQMLLGCILFAAGQLRKHGWIMGSQNKLFRNACTHERWDIINEDLQRYTNAVEAYETWRKRAIQNIEFGPLDLPLRSDRYGRILAVIEVASKSEDPDDRAVAEDLSRSLMHSHATWWRSHIFSRKFPHDDSEAKMDKPSIGRRMAFTTFGSMALIAPMLIMVLQPGLISRLVTTSLFTLAVACMLAYLMADTSQSSLMAIAAAYTAVLVVFVGNGAGA